MAQVEQSTMNTNPYPGLRPFDEDEQHLFFGRESQVDTLVDKLAASRFAAVVGTSGSGKSSLVNCGLLPALHAGYLASAGSSWQIAKFRPAGAPIREMAKALADRSTRIAEVLTDPAERRDFIETKLQMSRLALVELYESG